MAKFPTQNKLTYQTGDISYGGYTQVTSGGVTGDLCLPKDLSMLNRRGYASTTRKGVPLVYRTKFDFYLHDEDGAYGPPSVLDNLMVTLKVAGAQNNWVMRNAVVKFHAGREKMFRQAGVRKGDRGAYANEIRYNYDAANDSWLGPIDAGGDAFTGGTWDVTNLSYEGDTAFQLMLVGAGDDEHSDAFSGSVLSIGHSYLLSRSNQLSDTNLQINEGPAQFSVLQNMLDDNDNTATDSVITTDARDDQDNPPYEVLDMSASGDTGHDITEPVELGRCLSSANAAVGSTIVDIPFGLARLTARAYTSESTSGVDSVRGLIHAEVLDIYEMQG